MTASERWVFAAGLPPLHAEVFSAVGGWEKTKAAVLFVHGYGEHLGRHRELFAALTSAGYRVYAYDQRGHGRSPGKRAAVDVVDLVSDHLRIRRHVLDDLRAHAAKGPLFLAGHSLGGLVTASSAIADGTGVAGAVLLSPALLVGEDTPRFIQLLGRVVARIWPTAPTVQLDAAAISRIPAEVERYRQDPLVFRGKVPAVTASTMLGFGAAAREKAAELSVPALILHGTADALAEIAGSRRFALAAGAAHDPRPQVTLVEYEGAYHELAHDLVATEALAAVVDWLDGAVGQGA